MLNTNAAPVPSPIRLNIFSFQVAKDRQPRTKNGQPPHRTTGEASAACSQPARVSPMRCMRARPGTNSLMVMASSGNDSATLTQNRRVMSRSSLSSSEAVASNGSNAMPQIGHVPGPTWRTWGCMGQV